MPQWLHSSHICSTQIPCTWWKVNHIVNRGPWNKVTTDTQQTLKNCNRSKVPTLSTNLQTTHFTPLHLQQITGSTLSTHLHPLRVTGHCSTFTPLHPGSVQSLCTGPPVLYMYLSNEWHMYISGVEEAV